MEFTQQPVLTSPPRKHKFLVSEKKLIEKKIKGLESKGAVSRVPPVQDQLINNLFIVKKKDGKNRFCGVSALHNGRYFSPEKSVETK